MSALSHALLINGSTDHHWHKLVTQIIAPHATLHIGSEATLEDWLAQADYALMIVDATVVRDVPALIRRLRQLQPSARVIVASAAPSWAHARAAFLAGAFDYVLKSLNRDDIESAIVAALAAAPPAR